MRCITRAIVSFFLLSDPMRGMAHDDERPLPTPNSDTHAVTIRSEVVKTTPGGYREIKLSVQVAKGWSIYANPVGNDETAYGPTRVTIKENGRSYTVNYPPPSAQLDLPFGTKVNLYQGTVHIVVKAMRTENASNPITLHVTYYPTSAEKCGKVTTDRISVEQ